MNSVLMPKFNLPQAEEAAEPAVGVGVVTECSGVVAVPDLWPPG